jgi:hypothetical protein
MKVKALRYKDTKEFVHIMHMGEYACTVGTSEIPNIQPMTATLELMKEIYKDFSDINFDEMEFIEFDLIESGVVGADIRNKLGPIKNLLKLLSMHTEFDSFDNRNPGSLTRIIMEQIPVCEKNTKYLSDIL